MQGHANRNLDSPQFHNRLKNLTESVMHDVPYGDASRRVRVVTSPEEKTNSAVAHLCSTRHSRSPAALRSAPFSCMGIYMFKQIWPIN